MIRKLPAQEPRVESGPTRFGDDWTGVFIRGDNAHNFHSALVRVLGIAKGAGEPTSLRSDAQAALADHIAMQAVAGLADTLRSCDERNMKDRER